MKRFLISLLAALALPTTVEANWIRDKTFYLSCNKKYYKEDVGSNWIPFPENLTIKDGILIKEEHFDKLTLNEKENTAYLYRTTSQEHKKLDVLIFNRDTIKLTETYKEKAFYVKTTQTINRNDGEYIQKQESNWQPYQNPPIYMYTKGTCIKVKSQKNLF